MNRRQALRTIGAATVPAIGIVASYPPVIMRPETIEPIIARKRRQAMADLADQFEQAAGPVATSSSPGRGTRSAY